MILGFPVALAVAVAVLWRSRDRAGREGRGCRWFWGWSLVGIALGFSFLTGLSIGLLILPLALVLLGLALYLSPRWPESLGFVEGVGLLLLVVAYLHRGDQPCSSSGMLHHLERGSADQSVSCGGVDPHPWLYTGVVAAAVAAVLYAAARKISDARSD